MRNINVTEIEELVSTLYVKSNIFLPEDIKSAIMTSYDREVSQVGKQVLGTIRENWETAEEMSMPICQDTGMACVFIEAGQEVHFTGGSITEAVNRGIHNACINGYLRASVVSDPIERINTKDNTPAVIWYDITEGDKVKVTVVPKGFGSENMSRIAMLKPAEGIEGVKKFVLDTVENAGPNPCPPLIIGVGIGGTFEKAAYLSKKALARSTDIRNSVPLYASLEAELLEQINRQGTGPAGLGGRTTALAVNIEQYPTHIAGLPVAVNIGCHVTRHMTSVI